MRKLSRLLFMLLLMMSCSIQVSATSGNNTTTCDPIDFGYNNRTYSGVSEIGIIVGGSDPKNVVIFDTSDADGTYYAEAIKNYTGTMSETEQNKVLASLINTGEYNNKTYCTSLSDESQALVYVKQAKTGSNSTETVEKVYVTIIAANMGYKYKTENNYSGNEIVYDESIRTISFGKCNAWKDASSIRFACSLKSVRADFIDLSELFKNNKTIEEFDMSSLDELQGMSFKLDSTFRDSSIKHIELPSDIVISSANNAFEGSNIGSVPRWFELDNNAQARAAFKKCPIKSVNLSLSNFRGNEADLTGAFAECEQLKEVTMTALPSNATEMFKGCENIETIYLDVAGNMQQARVADMFSGVKALKSVFISVAPYSIAPTTLTGIFADVDIDILIIEGSLFAMSYDEMNQYRPLLGVKSLKIVELRDCDSSAILKYIMNTEGLEKYVVNNTEKPLQVQMYSGSVLPVVNSADDECWISTSGVMSYCDTVVTTAGLYHLFKYRYPIEYELNGGVDSGLETRYNVQVGLVDPGAPYKTGYTFTGWYWDKELSEKFEYIPAMHTGTVKLYASWKPNTYNIYYRLNNGINHEENIKKYTVGDTFTFKEPTKPHSEFLGWYTDSTYSTSITKILETTVGDKELVAKWEDVAYKITYELNDGVNNSKNPVVYYYGHGADFLEPTKENCIFEGWYLDAEFTKRVTGRDVTDFGDVTVYAKWSPIVCNIIYELDGGTNNASNPASFILGSDKIILQNPTRRNCSFLGWFSDIELTQPITEIDTSAAGDIIVYAKWYDYVGQDETAETYAASAPISPIIKKLKNTSSGKLKISFLGDGTRYQIKISTSKKFKAKNTKTYSTSKKNFTVKKLIKGKKYYVKIRAFHTINEKNVYSEWSKIKSTKIKK